MNDILRYKLDLPNVVEVLPTETRTRKQVRFARVEILNIDCMLERLTFLTHGSRVLDSKYPTEVMICVEAKCALSNSESVDDTGKAVPTFVLRQILRAAAKQVRKTKRRPAKAGALC